MVSHRSAASLWELLDPIDGPVHVMVPHARRERVGIRFHCSRDLGHGTKRHGIPVTTVPRTLFDLASVISPTQLRHAYQLACGRGQLDPRELKGLCQRSSGRRGLGALRALLDESPLPLSQTRSSLERRFLRFCRDRGLPIPAVNVPLAGYEVDCLWPDHRVAVELDSWTHHSNRDAFESDRQRDARVQLAGYKILRVTDRRMTEEGDELEADIRRLFRG
jgi:very-short-patch-repair endonuclease